MGRPRRRAALVWTPAIGPAMLALLASGALAAGCADSELLDVLGGSDGGPGNADKTDSGLANGVSGTSGTNGATGTDPIDGESRGGDRPLTSPRGGGDGDNGSAGAGAAAGPVVDGGGIDGGSRGLCGNGQIDDAEQCDGDELAGTACTDLGFAGGILGCDPTACVFDVSSCTAGPLCGNGLVEQGEQCEGSNLDGNTCESLGFDRGVLRCDPSTCVFNVSSCFEGPRCGDGVIDEGEQCDGNDLNGRDCVSLGFGGGALACIPDQCVLDVSACTAPPNCGNGIIEDGEQCDGSNLDGMTCAGMGYQTGTLACDPETCTFDTYLCTRMCCTRGGCYSC